MLLKRFYDEKLAQASYMVGCQATGEALIVDPNRDFEQFLDAAAEEGMKIVAVTETHIHADFASGSRELAKKTGARLFLSGEGGPDWQYEFADEAGAQLLYDGDSFWVGNVRIDAMHTPGHTPEHLSFALTDTPATDKVMGVFSGDFVFVGDVGRPDLLERAAGFEGTMEAAARKLFASLGRFKQLEDYVQIWPGHGAGSACGKGLGAVPSSTVGYERVSNWAFQIQEEAKFVEEVLAGQPEAPRYFAHMKHINKVGPALRAEQRVPRGFALERLVELVDGGVDNPAGVVVDVRAAEKYAAGHIPGTLNIALGRAFTTWAGWLLSYERPIYLLLDEGEQAAAREDAVTSLATIGLDQVVGYFDGSVLDAWQRSGRALEEIKRVSVEEVQAHQQDESWVVVDVRGQGERDAGHIPGTRHIPLGYLAARLGELPSGKPVAVHCQGGMRSPIAASLLRAHGVSAVLDMNAGFAGWRQEEKPVQQQ